MELITHQIKQDIRTAIASSKILAEAPRAFVSSVYEGLNESKKFVIHTSALPEKPMYEFVNVPYETTFYQVKLTAGIVCLLVTDISNRSEYDLAIVRIVPENIGRVYYLPMGLISYVSVNNDGEILSTTQIVKGFYKDENISDENVMYTEQHSISCVLAINQLLSCSNIGIQHHSKPKFLNKKRKKKNKIPFDDYYTLTIDSHKKQSKCTGKKIHDRRSPRFHLRRGHIRRLSNGKKIWINSFAVGAGDGGVIHKNYKVV